MKTAMKISIVVLVLAFIAGCVTTTMDDGTKKWSLDPILGKKAEEAGEATLGILTVLAPLLGPAGGIAVGGLATGLTILKKARPKLQKSQDRYELSNTVASISVDAIEQIKKDHPKVWAELSAKLQQECEESRLDTKLITNAIRGLRGLPAKV